MPQSLSSVLIHVIFSTKNRYPWITSEVEPELYAYMIALWKDLGCPSLQINGMLDHIHILFFLSRTVCLSEVVMKGKKESSKWIKSKGPQFREFAWQQGYGVFSVSESNADRVKDYIKNQKSHHATRTFEDEYVAFLDKHNVPHDKRYLWD